MNSDKLWDEFCRTGSVYKYIEFVSLREVKSCDTLQRKTEDKRTCDKGK